MKTCTKCGATKSFAEFSVRLASGDGLNSWCKVCKRSRDNEYYRSSEDRRSKIRESNARAEKANRQYLWDYLLAHPCLDCGESDPVVLEFDHVRGKKLGNLSQLATDFSLKNIVLEIEKCEVRCANCHRRITALRGGWHKSRQ